MKWRKTKGPPPISPMLEERVGPYLVRIVRANLDGFYFARIVTRVNGQETWSSIATGDTPEKALRSAAERLGYEADE